MKRKEQLTLAAMDRGGQAEALRKDLANVRPAPPPARRPPGRLVAVNLERPKMLPDGSMSVGYRAFLWIDGRKHLFDDCTYRLALASGAWRVDEQKSECLLF